MFVDDVLLSNSQMKTRFKYIIVKKEDVSSHNVLNIGFGIVIKCCTKLHREKDWIFLFWSDEKDPKKVE